MIDAITAAAIRERVERATPGPWVSNHPFALLSEVLSGEKTPIVSWQGFDDSNRAKKRHKGNALFIAHARADVPALLADRAERVRLLAQKDVALQLIVAVADCLLFASVHDVIGVTETCDKFGIEAEANPRKRIQLLAKKATDTARTALSGAPCTDHQWAVTAHGYASGRPDHPRWWLPDKYLSNAKDVFCARCSVKANGVKAP